MAGKAATAPSYEEMGGVLFINGKPAAQVRTGMYEKIPHVQYGSLDLGPISITRYVEDTPEARTAGLDEAMMTVEEFFARERKVLMDAVAKMKSGG